MPVGKQGVNGPAIANKIAMDRPGIAFNASRWRTLGLLPANALDGSTFYDATGNAVLIGVRPTSGGVAYLNPWHVDLETFAVTQGPAFPGTALGSHPPAICQLQDGRIMLHSPRDATPNKPYIYDPNARTWTAAALMPVARIDDTFITLPSGKVLCIGGRTTGFVLINQIDVYDPSVDSWSTDTAVIPAAAIATATTFDMPGIAAQNGMAVLQFAGGAQAKSVLTWVPGNCAFTTAFFASGKNAAQEGGRQTQFNQCFVASNDGFILVPSNVSQVSPISPLEKLSLAGGTIAPQSPLSGAALLGGCGISRPDDGAVIMWDTFSGQNGLTASPLYSAFTYSQGVINLLPVMPIKKTVMAIAGGNGRWIVMGGSVGGVGTREIYAIQG